MMSGTAIQDFIGGRTWPAGSGPDTLRARETFKSWFKSGNKCESGAEQHFARKAQNYASTAFLSRCNSSHAINNPMALKVPSCAAGTTR